MRYVAYRDGVGQDDRIQEFETKQEAIAWGDERESCEVYYLDFNGIERQCFAKRPGPEWAEFREKGKPNCARNQCGSL